MRGGETKGMPLRVVCEYEVAPGYDAGEVGEWLLAQYMDAELPPGLARVAVTFTNEVA